ncbi:hypothetical protein ACLFMI_05880 [Pseudonocardia nantongensis]|uniref:hypothetical protein n=1 Tax=Pseudonocardia nantongensis TaxID=1181885 RepID=UPI00397D6B1D
MNIAANAPRGTASDSLMSQVNVDNVMQVHRMLARQVVAMQRALGEAAWLRDIPRCANDLVSIDAKEVFQPKIDQIMRVHEEHLSEVREARDRLKDAAVQYGFTEHEVADSIKTTELRPVQHGPWVHR